MRVDFDRRLKLEFHGSTITSDAGLLAYRELDEVLGLTDPRGGALSDLRRGKNTRHLLTRSIGRPPNYVRVFHASFSYQAATWDKSRRVVAKVEWHPGELYPRVGFMVTNLSSPSEPVTKFYNGRGAAEQHIKDGKHAINWTRLSCHSFRSNEVRLQLHALA